MGGNGANQIGERAPRSIGSGAAEGPSDAWLARGGGLADGATDGGPAQLARISPARQVAARRDVADTERGDCGSDIAIPVGLARVLGRKVSIRP
jgi:hypothetical protein